MLGKVESVATQIFLSIFRPPLCTFIHDLSVLTVARYSIGALINHTRTRYFVAGLQGIDRGYHLLDKQQSLAPGAIARVRTPHRFGVATGQGDNNTTAQNKSV